MSPLGRLPVTWLSHCLSYLDLPALLAAGSVSTHWRAAQQARAAWTCTSLEEGCSRAWTPNSFTQLASPPPVFRRLLCAMRVDMERLAPLRDEDEEEFDYEGQVAYDPAHHAHAWPTLTTLHPIPEAFMRGLFESFAALRCLSVRDAQEVLSPTEIGQLCRLAVERLAQLSIERDEFKPQAMLSPLLQPPSTLQTQLKHLRLHTDAVDSTVVPLPLSAMDTVYALPSSVTSPSSSGSSSASSSSSSASTLTGVYSWPLIPSLTSLTITIAQPRMLHLLSMLQQLTALDLDVKFAMETEEQRSECDAAWSCLHSITTADSIHRSSRVEPSSWVHSLHTLHLSTLRLSDATVRAVSHLAALTGLAILDTHDVSADDACVHDLVAKADGDTSLVECFESLLHPAPLLTPTALLQLRRLTKLVKLELNLQVGWTLALVPFLLPPPFTPVGRSLDSAALPETDDASSLAFWSSFPDLFQLKLHVQNQDLPCLPSLALLNTSALHRAASAIAAANHGTHARLFPQDLLLYTLGASHSLRSVHLNPTHCGAASMRTFTDRTVLAHIPRAPRVESLCDSMQPLDVSDPAAGRPPALLPLFDICLFWLPKSLDGDALALEASRYASTLRYLHLISFHSLHDRGLMHVLRSCALLHTLDIRGCASLTPASLREIGSCIPLLHSLNLSFMSCVDDALVSSIVVCTPALHSLHLEQTATTSQGLLPLLAERLHLLCLNVRCNHPDRWQEQQLADYKNSRDYAIQLQSDFEETGEK